MLSRLKRDAALCLRVKPNSCIYKNTYLLHIFIPGVQSTFIENEYLMSIYFCRKCIHGSLDNITFKKCNQIIYIFLNRWNVKCSKLHTGSFPPLNSILFELKTCCHFWNLHSQDKTEGMLQQCNNTAARLLSQLHCNNVAVITLTSYI